MAAKNSRALKQKPWSPEISTMVEGYAREFEEPLYGLLLIEERARMIQAGQETPPIQELATGSVPFTEEGLVRAFFFRGMHYLSRGVLLEEMRAGNAGSSFAKYRKARIGVTEAGLALQETMAQYQRLRRGEPDPRVFAELQHLLGRAERVVVNGAFTHDQIALDAAQLLRGHFGEIMTIDVLRKNDYPETQHGSAKKDALEAEDAVAIGRGVVVPLQIKTIRGLEPEIEVTRKVYKGNRVIRVPLHPEDDQISLRKSRKEAGGLLRFLARQGSPKNKNRYVNRHR